MTNPTALAFGYPGSKIAETDHWLILVRPKQPTFGSLVLVCKETVRAFSEVSPPPSPTCKSPWPALSAF